MTLSNRFVVSDEHHLLGIHLTVGNSSHSTPIEAKWFKFDSGSNILQETSTHVLLLPCIPSQTKLLACQKVLSAVTGERSPYLLVASKPDCGSNVVLYILGASEKLYIAAKTNLRDFDIEDNMLDIRLLDGPSVLILQKTSGQFYLIHRIFSNSDTGYVTSELGHYSGKIKFECLGLSSVCPFNSHLFLTASAKYSSGKTCVTLHTIHKQRSNLSNNGNVQSKLLQTQIEIYGCKVKHDTATSNLIPSSYSDIVTCAISVPSSRCHSFFHNSHFDEINDHSHDACVAEDVVISTKFGQIINFCNGQLMCCEEIPFADVTTMCLVDTFDSEYVVATSHKGGIHAAKLEDLKPVHHWSSAKQAIVGDFLQNGTDQLLLLPLGAWNGTNTIISSFYFTDFGFCSVDRCSITEGNEEEEMEEGTSSNLETIVEHLESRLQCGMSALHDSERVCQEKAELVQRSSNNLMSMTLGAELANGGPKQCNLVNLFISKDNTIHPQTSGSGAGDQAQQPWEVTDVWQRTVGNQWVVGVDVIDRTGRPTKEVALSLVQDTIQMQNRSKIYRCPAETNTKSSNEPLSKRRKLSLQAGGSAFPSEIPEDVISLTVSTDIPRFSTPTISCQLLISWTYAKSLGGAGDACFVSNKCDAQWICGQVSLCADDVIQRKIELQLNGKVNDVSEVRRILLCLNTCQQETRLNLQSAFITKESLIEAMAKIGLSYQKFYQCYMCFTPGPLYLIRVSLEEGGQGIELTVNTNDDNQLVLLTQTLYSSLPDDLIIQHGRHNDLTGAMESAHKHMTQEVDQSYYCINEVMKSSNRISGDLLEANGSDITDLRKNFEQKKRKFVNEELDCSGSSLLRHTQAKALTDEALSNMLKKSSYF